MTKPEKVLAGLVVLAGLALQVKRQGTLGAIKDLASNGFFAVLWAVCVFGCWLAYKAAKVLRREDIKAYDEYMPILHYSGPSPARRRPSKWKVFAPAVVMNIVFIAVSALSVQHIPHEPLANPDSSQAPRPRAWLQVTRTYSPTPHAITLILRNFGQIPSFNNRLTQSFEIDRLDKSTPTTFAAPGVTRYDQTSSQGEFSIMLGTDNPMVRQFLEEHRPAGFFSVRVRGSMEYSDTETSVPHSVKMCYVDFGFISMGNTKWVCNGSTVDCASAKEALKTSSKIVECAEAGLNVSM